MKGTVNPTPDFPDARRRLSGARPRSPAAHSSPRAPAILAAVALAACAATGGTSTPERADRPNLVVIFFDDLGWGDLGSYGAPTIRTPHLDAMAAAGLRFTEFYSAASVCTPSRAALLTGRYAVRSGMCGHSARAVMRENGIGGLPADEVTLAEALGARGYVSMAIGKWHLGHLPEHLPTRHGFDRFFGVPWSNDMEPYYFIDGEERLAGEIDQSRLTERLTDEALAFVRANADRPFFLYLAHPFPHTPLAASPAFRGQSPRGLYGDVVEELDASTGRILAELRALDLDERTLVLVTSDNGPWLTEGQDGGSAGPLRDGKGSTFEGGMRVPAIAWWPGTIPPGRVTNALASTLDVLPTAVSLAGGELPAGRVLDGYDLSAVLRSSGPSDRDRLLYHRGREVWAARLGPWKAHFRTRAAYGPGELVLHDPPLLYHLGHDPGEQWDRSADHPDVIAAIRAIVREHEASFEPPPSQLERFPE